jgi:c-di-GMP-binding flagellar brake protein YcgR
MIANLAEGTWLLSVVEVTMIECREHPRIAVDLQVFFSTTNQTDIRQGTMFDISAGGCAVTSTAPVAPGAGVKLLIQATDLAVPITVHSAAVRWVNHGEFGVEFVRLTDVDRNRLQRLLHIATPRSVPQD